MIKNRLKRLQMLMVISSLLLTAFVVQWLIGQYNEEHMSLTMELMREFKLSEEKTLDTMLLTHVIRPIIRHHTPANINDTLLQPGASDRVMTGRTDSIIFTNRQVTQREDAIHAQEERILSGLSNDSTGHDKIFSISAKDSEEPQNRMLLKGFKMLATLVQDSFSKIEPDVLAFFTYPDTSFFLNSFNEKIDKRNFHAVWKMQGDTTKETGTKAGINLESSLFREKIAVRISGYNFYLIRQIAPHIFFAFVLLSLSGAAFVISYRNLKKQYQLTGIRNAFVSNITHELKTPVATMKVALEALHSFRGAEDPQLTKEYLGIFAQETERLDQLIQKVLSVSVYEESSQWMHLAPIDLRELVQDIITSVKPRFELENATMNLETNGNNFHIIADKLHVQGAILNLIDNSLKYGQTVAELKFTLESTGSSVQFSLSDNGKGIPPEYHSRVFDRFFRVPSGDIHDIKGYGLGLTYVYMVMKHHGGTVSLKNNPASGCTFTLTFPKSRI